MLHFFVNISKTVNISLFYAQLIYIKFSPTAIAPLTNSNEEVVKMPSLEVYVSNTGSSCIPNWWMVRVKWMWWNHHDNAQSTTVWAEVLSFLPWCCARTMASGASVSQTLMSIIVWRWGRLVLEVPRELGLSFLLHYPSHWPTTQLFRRGKRISGRGQTDFHGFAGSSRRKV